MVFMSLWEEMDEVFENHRFLGYWFGWLGTKRFSWKKGGKWFVVLVAFLYGRFLIVRSASTMPIMTITIIIAATPNSTVLVDARPVGGAAVGGGVAAAALSVKVDSAFDPQ
jgi:hypothetical protein